MPIRHAIWKLTEATVWNRITEYTQGAIVPMFGEF